MKSSVNTENYVCRCLGKFSQKTDGLPFRGGEEELQKQSDNTKPPQDTSITQRLRADLGRSVGVTTATLLVWLNRYTGSQPSY